MTTHTVCTSCGNSVRFGESHLCEGEGLTQVVDNSADNIRAIDSNFSGGISDRDSDIYSIFGEAEDLDLLAGTDDSYLDADITSDETDEPAPLDGKLRWA